MLTFYNKFITYFQRLPDFFIGSKRSRKKIDEVVDLFNTTYRRLETESIRHAMVGDFKILFSFSKERFSKERFQNTLPCLTAISGFES